VLLAQLKIGATLEVADMKYGWPHKFYVEGIANERAGQVVKLGREYCSEGYKPLLGEAPRYALVKFRSEHLLDLADAEFAELVELIQVQTGAQFVRGPEALLWRKAPKQVVA
jgi:hypothetical protein